jgi:hypothetical protein
LVSEEPVTDENRAEFAFSAVGPEGVQISLRRDGIVIFEFHKSAAYSGGSVTSYQVSATGHVPDDIQRMMEARFVIREQRYRYMNAYLSCFNGCIRLSHMLPKPSGPDNYIWAEILQGEWSLSDGRGSDLTSVPYTSLISSGALEESMRAFHECSSKHYDLALDILNLLYKSSFYLNNHDFQTNIILSWVILERCQNILWEDFIKGGYRQINPRSEIAGKRKKLLLEDKNFTASIKSQVLGIAGVYSDAELAALDTIRKKRNAFMHGLESVTNFEALRASLSVVLFIRKALGVNLEPFGGPQSWDRLG